MGWRLFPGMGERWGSLRGLLGFSFTLVPSRNWSIKILRTEVVLSASPAAVEIGDTRHFATLPVVKKFPAPLTDPGCSDILDKPPRF